MSNTITFKPGDSKGSLVFNVQTDQPAMGEFARVTAEGKITLNWHLTEKAAKLTENQMVQSIAQLMIAIRDGTYDER